ncbi:MAG: magnesium transporter CorA family protein [Anaerolineae bacterium]|nr:magnesium transporter CorA family protein [Anaerolineae bacterium]
MIRSLVVQFDETPEAEVAVRRNLEREKLEATLDDEHMVWIDIVDPDPEELDWLAQRFELNPAVVQDLQREDRRPALLVYPQYLFLSLFQPSVHITKVDGKEIHCIITDHCFITVRPSDATAVDDAYDRIAQNPDAWRAGVAYLLYLTAQYVIDAYYPLLDRVSNRLNDIEEKLLSGELKNKKANRPVYQIKQQLINMRQMVAPQREVLSSVIGEQRVSESGVTRDLFRHLYERLLRIYDVIDSQRDLSSNVLDMLQNQESQRMMEAVNRLTIFSMIFLPLTFLSGFFELNFATTSDPIVLPVTGSFMFTSIIVLMVISAVAMTILFRRRGWL